MFRRRRAAKRVTLYGKPGCHLCEEARDLLDRLGERYPIELTEVDITSDPELFRRYDVVIPVIAIEGFEEIEAPIDAKRVEKALRRR